MYCTPATPHRAAQGIHLHGNTFRMLELAGARDAIDRLGSSETAGQAAFAQHRNGITDELLKEIDWTSESGLWVLVPD